MIIKEYSIREISKDGKLKLAFNKLGVPCRFKSTSYEKTKKFYETITESNNYNGKLVIVEREVSEYKPVI